MSENVTTRAKDNKLDAMLRVDNYTPEFDSSSPRPWTT